MSALRDFGERRVHSGLSTLGDFRKFILRGNVVDFAVGIVIGVAFTAVVTAMVKDLITPLIGLFGNIDFSKLQFTSLLLAKVRFSSVISSTQSSVSSS